ncbi:hypothetical protein BCR42DRAFT_426966 [Absidia repens]|uniref:Uncharacterized protein n=1 Tax=Absidia repens TaxID=90262 RepID=A0A1X2I0E2_9FUNG|nr:hypothetical protein BCR42DRAFT_426966 [Absidia repens]
MARPPNPTSSSKPTHFNKNTLILSKSKISKDPVWSARASIKSQMYLTIKIYHTTLPSNNHYHHHHQTAYILSYHILYQNKKNVTDLFKTIFYFYLF